MLLICKIRKLEILFESNLLNEYLYILIVRKWVLFVESMSGVSCVF